MDEQEYAPDLVALTTDVVAAYVAHNSVNPTDLPTLIADVHSALRTTHAGEPAARPLEQQKPAVPIKKAVTPEAVICLECGRKMKSLKRHLGTDHELAPDQYRTKWNLPKDYPIIAPAYAERRSELAKTHGLGRKAANPAGGECHACSTSPHHWRFRDQTRPAVNAGATGRARVVGYISSQPRQHVRRGFFTRGKVSKLTASYASELGMQRPFGLVAT